MNKNLLIITTVSGFVEKFEIENIKQLLEMGYNIHIATNSKEKLYLFDEDLLGEMGVQQHHIDIARSPYMIRSNARALKQLIKIVKDQDINIVHCHAPVGGALGRLIKIFHPKLKVIYTAHGFHFYKGAPTVNNTIYYLAEKIFARFTNVLIVINKEDYDAATNKLKLAEGGKVYQLPSIGLDLVKFRPVSKEERLSARERHNLKEDDFFFVSVGELNNNKNQLFVIDTLNKMNRMSNLDISKIKYGIIGHGFLQEDIADCIKKYNLEETITMYGYCKDVTEILACADALIFPTIREGFGMACVEALAMNVFVIAADNRGTKEYMEHKKNGYVFTNNIESELMNAIEYFLNLDINQREIIANNAREKVQEFDINKVKKIVRDIYLELEKV